MAWLLDTNIISEFRRSSPSQRVIGFIASHDTKDFFVSSVTMAELRYGISQTSDFAQKQLLEAWLSGEVRPLFAGRILEITEDILLRWRALLNEGRKTGRTFSQPDLFIAAIAIEHRLVLVTRNTKDFAGLPVSLLNPWEL